MGKNNIVIEPAVKTVAPPPRIDQVEIGNVGKIILSEKIKNQIDYLHSKIGNSEWSGVLVFTHESGNIEDLKDLVFKAHSLYLMDIGSGTLTEFEYTSAYTDVFEHIEEAMEGSTGLIHSHHSMGAFHSGTDMAELEKNSSLYNYYVSLVVDTRDTHKCKVAFPSLTKVTTTKELKNTNGEVVTATASNEKFVHLIGDLTVEFTRESSVDTWFEERYEEIKKEKAKPVYRTYHNYGESYTPIIGYGRRGYSNVRAYTPDAPLYQSPHIQQEFDFDFDGGMFNERESISKKDRLFANALLYADSTIPLNIYKGVANLNLLSEDDMKLFLELLDTNIEILHNNVYGNNDVKLLEHLKSAKEHLEYYTKSVGENNLNKLIDFLEEYGEVTNK